MNWIIWTFIGLGVVVVVLAATGYWRYVLTGYLIARVTPYEQPGGGAGSILVIGDSTGYGTGASRSEDSIAGRLGADYSWYTIQNDSVNGRTIAGALEVVRGLTENDQYSLVLLQIGANDMLGGASAQETVARMQELIEVVREHTQQIVIVTSGNIGGIPKYEGAEALEFENTSRDYTNAMIDLANQYQEVSFVPLFDEPAEDPFVASPSTHTSIDGLHPTSLGYGVWYSKAKPYFDTVLDSKGDDA